MNAKIKNPMLRHNSLLRIKDGVCVVCDDKKPIKCKGMCQRCYDYQAKLKYAKRYAEQDKIAHENGAEDESLELKRWFEERRKELTGQCAHCGGHSCKDNDQYWKFSIAHILPKAIFKSVATHPLNFIELCFFNNSCHTNFDNKTLDIMDLNCFDTIIQRFVAMYPSINPRERRYIPDVLLQYVEIEK